MHALHFLTETLIEKRSLIAIPRGGDMLLEQRVQELVAAFECASESDQDMILALTKRCATNQAEKAPVRVIITYPAEAG